jgi:hypothetical protein
VGGVGAVVGPTAGGGATTQRGGEGAVAAARAGPKGRGMEGRCGQRSQRMTTTKSTDGGDARAEVVLEQGRSHSREE